MRLVKNTYTDLTPSEILELICHERREIAKKRTYIIMGEIGPTGKTWLWRGLKSMGFNAIELSETVYDLVCYISDANRNFYRVSDDVGVIVLNQTLPQYKIGE